MGINHPRRGTQRRPGDASFWADEPAEAAVSLLEENALRADEPTVWSGNTPTASTPCPRGMLGSGGGWLSCRTSSAKTSFTQGNAVSRWTAPIRGSALAREMISPRWRITP